MKKLYLSKKLSCLKYISSFLAETFCIRPNIYIARNKKNWVWEKIYINVSKKEKLFQKSSFCLFVKISKLCFKSLSFWYKTSNILYINDNLFVKNDMFYLLEKDDNKNVAIISNKISNL